MSVLKEYKVQLRLTENKEKIYQHYCFYKNMYEALLNSREMKLALAIKEYSLSGRTRHEEV